ncbi:MAG: glycoside hydrolase family 18 protein [Gammaproteobacteria bacterium]
MANPANIRNFGQDNCQQLAKNVTYISVMGYDMHGSFDKSNPFTALQSALFSDHADYSDQSAIEALNGVGIPNEKIILGLPMYGRAVGNVQVSGLGQVFTQAVKGDLDDSNCCTNLNVGNVCGDMIQYKNLVDQQYQAIPVSVSGKTSGVYAYQSTQKIFVSYDNPDSATVKANYALDKNLAGVMFWALRFDKPVLESNSILGAVDKVFGIQPSAGASGTDVKLELTNNDPNHPITITLVTANKANYYPFPVLTAKGQSGSDVTYSTNNSEIVNTLKNNDGVLVLLTSNGNQVWCQGSLNFTSGSNHHIQVYYDNPVPNCLIQ